MTRSYIFTSESVTEGHPDKICDQISDAFLDEYLRQDPDSRVAIETMTTTDFVAVVGAVTSTAKFDKQAQEEIVIKTIREIDKKTSRSKKNFRITIGATSWKITGFCRICRWQAKKN